MRAWAIHQSTACRRVTKRRPCCQRHSKIPQGGNDVADTGIVAIRDNEIPDSATIVKPSATFVAIEPTKSYRSCRSTGE